MAFIVTAAIALLLIELFLRRRPWAIALTAFVAVVGTAVWLFSADQSRQQQNAVSAVTVTVAADPTVCADPQLPIAATLTNASGQAVNRLSFDLIGREPDETRIAYRGTLRHNGPLAPDETMTRCYALLFHGFAHPRPQIVDATKYEWTAHVSLVGFGEAPVE
jgi:4-amino-4-deoxy-L-arabinose transferase-like glycosyltransferase